MRSKEDQFFVESEMILILYGLIGALSVLEIHRITH